MDPARTGRPLNVLIVVAMELEARVVRKACPNAPLLVTGVGARSAERAITQALADSPPDAVLHVGWAGGLRAGLARGDLVLVTAADGLAVPDDLLDPVRNALARLPCRLSQGPLATASRVVAEPVDKLALGRATGALAVDMESGPVARACSEAGVPWIGLRAISDPADQRLPPIGLRATFRFLARPGAPLDLLRTIDGARRANASLALAIPAALSALATASGAGDRGRAPA